MRRFLILSIFFLYCSSLYAEEATQSSPKPGWGEFEVVEETEPQWWRTALLWIPNRLLDLVDVVRADVGVGIATGGVLRATKYAQAGYRSISPTSVRVGLLGRRAPILVEHSSEIGVSPAFLESAERKVCTYEFGLGIDLIVPGAYLGICGDELEDFFMGIATLDPSKDDLK